MPVAENHHQIDYIEFGATDIEATKQFYHNVFGWEFTDYGPDYTSFADGRIAGGFTTDGTVGAGALIVIYSSGLDATLQKVRAAGGSISKEIFSFPGGRRFHFIDPNGNELAVWSE